MTEQELFNVCIETVEELRQSIFIPWDSGNMASNALKYEIFNGVFHIYMDLDEAPYTPYTNEPWLSEKWHGKQNPNEGWWNEWCETFMQRLAVKLKGDLRE